ncbi:MAG: hypothetical protein WCH10_01635 [bacterium]
MKNYSVELRQAFPYFLQNDINAILNILDLTTEIHSDQKFEVVIDNEILFIPERIYFNENSYTSLLEKNFLKKLSPVITSG